MNSQEQRQIGSLERDKQRAEYAAEGMITSLNIIKHILNLVIGMMFSIVVFMIYMTLWGPNAPKASVIELIKMWL